MPKRTIRVNGNINHIVKPNNFGNFQNLYQDKASMDMTVSEIKLSTATCWDQRCQPLTIDMTKVEYTGRYRLGLSTLLISNTNPF